VTYVIKDREKEKGIQSNKSRRRSPKRYKCSSSLCKILRSTYKEEEEEEKNDKNQLLENTKKRKENR